MKTLSGINNDFMPRVLTQVSLMNDKPGIPEILSKIHHEINLLKQYLEVLNTQSKSSMIVRSKIKFCSIMIDLVSTPNQSYIDKHDILKALMQDIVAAQTQNKLPKMTRLKSAAERIENSFAKLSSYEKQYGVNVVQSEMTQSLKRGSEIKNAVVKKIVLDKHIPLNAGQVHHINLYLSPYHLKNGTLSSNNIITKMKEFNIPIQPDEAKQILRIPAAPNPDTIPEPTRAAPTRPTNTASSADDDEPLMPPAPPPLTTPPPLSAVNTMLENPNITVMLESLNLMLNKIIKDVATLSNTIEKMAGVSVTRVGIFQQMHADAQKTGKTFSRAEGIFDGKSTSDHNALKAQKNHRPGSPT
jgi:hypothetical protein